MRTLFDYLPMLAGAAIFSFGNLIGLWQFFKAKKKDQAQWMAIWLHVAIFGNAIGLPILYFGVYYLLTH